MRKSNLFFLVSILTIFTNIIKSIGKDKIKNKIYLIYTRSPFAGKDLDKLSQLRKERIQVNRQRNTISAQDNYAKWTKLNRKFDKLTEELKKEEVALAKKKARFDLNVDRVITFITVVPNNLVNLWYSRVPLLYLPYGLLPAFLEIFVLNFPFLPRGSIGVIIWSFCLNKTLNFFIVLFKYLLFTKPVQKPVKTF